MPGERIGAVAGELVDAEAMLALKDLLAALGSRTSNAARTARRSMPRAATSTPSTPASPGIEEADALLIIGSNPRTEAPVINARIRKRVAGGRVPGRLRRAARARPDLSAMTGWARGV